MYDLKSRQLSNPVYIMSGGRSIDNHNWPAITIDSAGYLHVLASGHQDPLNYAHSEKPLNIEEWTAPEYIEDPRWPNTYLSYPTLNFDKNDNLYCVARNSSCRSHREPNVWSDFSAYEEKSLSGQYNNRLSLFIKTRTDKWKFKEDVIVPSSFGYKNWGHKMALNRQTGQMCLSYYSQSNLKFLWGDSYAWAIFIWPDSEIQYNRGKKVVGGLNGGDPFSQPASTYMGGMDIATELTSLIYNPEVGQWKLLSSSDLR